MKIEQLKNYKNISDIDYLCTIGDALKLGIFASTPLYSYMITNLYEILDQEENTLEELYNKVVKIQAKADKILKDEGIEIKYFADLFDNIFEDLNISYQNRISLSTICMAFISWKLDLLDMDSYYEIRDMFVPFGMNITEDTYNVDALYSKYQEYIKASNIKQVRLLCKVGKTLISDLPTEEQLIKDAFNEIYFDEMAND